MQMLLRHYGGVPLIGDNIYEIDDEMKTSRDTYADCVEYIVSECKQLLAICLTSSEESIPDVLLLEHVMD